MNIVLLQHICLTWQKLLTKSLFIWNFLWNFCLGLSGRVSKTLSWYENYSSKSHLITEDEISDILARSYLWMMNLWCMLHWSPLKILHWMIGQTVLGKHQSISNPSIHQYQYQATFHPCFTDCSIWIGARIKVPFNNYIFIFCANPIFKILYNMKQRHEKCVHLGDIFGLEHLSCIFLKSRGKCP